MFKTWFGDDYLSELYRQVGSTFICSTHLYQNANRVGGHQPDKNRYEPTTEMADKWRDIAIKDSELIKIYLENNDLGI